MFTRLTWRIAASYVALIAIVLLGLGFYLVDVLALSQAAPAIAAALAVATLLATVLAIGLARVTTRPLAVLTEATRRLGRGELHQPALATSWDEVGTLSRAFNEMAARVRSYVGAVEQERDRLAAVLDHMADGALIVDTESLVPYLNPAAARLLRISAQRAEGRSLITVLRHHELAEVVSQVLTGEQVEHRQLIELGPPAERRTIQAMASLISGTEGSRERVLLILQDVTDLRRTETVRREFVANVSHELRTPVAALKALVETLEDGALETPEARHFLARMHVEVDGLAQLLEELLQLARIESGQLALRAEEGDLGEVTAATAERLRPFAERQGLRLAVQVSDDLPAALFDPERIQQVIANLVHNAVKFTPPGGQVSVAVEHRDDQLAVVVADDGIGIAPEALPRLFERFYKGDPARAGGGTGLGLAIAKHLVQAHGGRIWAESSGEGQGSAFTFTLPVSAR